MPCWLISNFRNASAFWENSFYRAWGTWRIILSLHVKCPSRDVDRLTVTMIAKSSALWSVAYAALIGCWQREKEHKTRDREGRGQGMGEKERMKTERKEKERGKSEKRVEEETV